jgi:hypothetical protein
MARKKTTEGGEGDLIERESPGHDIGQAETESGHGPIVGTDYSANPEYVAAQEATKNDAAAEDEESAARVAHAPTNSASERTAIKQANFKRLCDKRVTKILIALDVLKNLANTNSYDWTTEQQEKILDTIEAHLTDLRLVFENAKKAKVRDKSQLRFEV